MCSGWGSRGLVVAWLAAAAVLASQQGLHHHHRRLDDRWLLYHEEDDDRSPASPAQKDSSPIKRSEFPLPNPHELMVRTARGNRQFDVPQIECPPTGEDVMERFACPTPDRMGRYRCIDDHVLCDGFIDCPNGEDEDRRACMFYKSTKAHLDILADALLRWARGR